MVKEKGETTRSTHTKRQPTVRNPLTYKSLNVYRGTPLHTVGKEKNPKKVSPSPLLLPLSLLLLLLLPPLSSSSIQIMTIHT